MMEMIRQWLIGITCAAMIIALADSLTPTGTVGKIGRLVGGLVLLLAVIKPLYALDYSAMAIAMTDYQAASEAFGVDLAEVNTDLMKTIIGEQTGAYILDKADALGVRCTLAEVTCAVGENGMAYPAAVIITGNWTDQQRQMLSRQIEADLAIPAERQTYESGERDER